MKNFNEIIVQKEKIVKEFLELTSIDSVSFSERNMADVLTEKLRQMGFQVSEDNQGEKLNGNSGNIYGFLPGTLPGKSILLSSHMDTVQPGIGKAPILHDDGTITSDGTTVLGADDVAGLVEILEGIRSAKESGKPLRDVEVLFPIAEELYCKGTRDFDYSKIKSKEAYVLDMSGDIGSAAIQAPSIISLDVTVTGKAAHAGFEPENGINAIQLVGQALNLIRQGHIDEETTANIGTIQGGTATNIVSEQCSIAGEIRSYDHQKALDEIEKIRSVFEKITENTGAELIANIITASN